MSVKTTPPPRRSAERAAVRVIRRDGTVSAFDPNKISVALTKAFLAVECDRAAASSRMHHVVTELTGQVENSLLRHAGHETTLQIEQIQDLVELALMRGGHHKAARAYVLHREERAQARKTAKPAGLDPSLHVKSADGTVAPLDWARLEHVVGEAVAGIEDTAAGPVMAET